jgi:hypothetical protein
VLTNAAPKLPKPGDPEYRVWLLQQKRKKRRANEETPEPTEPTTEEQ